MRWTPLAGLGAIAAVLALVPWTAPGAADAAPTPAAPTTHDEAARGHAADMPAWLKEHFELLTAGSGRWIADNARYRSADEPAEAYGTEWKWGLGRQTVTGRLFSLESGRETAQHWEFRVWWDPAAGRAIVAQWGATGIVGLGPLTSRHGGADTESDQTFAWPDGSEHRTRHHTLIEGNVKRTESFDWVDGAWSARRTYSWRRTTG